MKKTALICSFLTLMGNVISPCGATSVFSHFVTVKGDQLVENGIPFRFISFNLPNLHLVEDRMVFEDANAWRWPDAFEITDALTSVRQQGGTVVRTYVLSVVRTNDAAGVPRHVLGPGQFNEEGFRVLDRVLQVANQVGVRVILPFVDNWSWWGGIAEYAGFRGLPKEAFWRDPQVKADFQKTIRFVINRTNTLTGTPYRHDPAILCWETGNELQSPADWTREMAAYIKSLDAQHPVMDGYHTTELRAESLAMPEIDIVTTHHYPGGAKSFADLVRENWQKAKGRKPYVVGEFGFMETPHLAATLKAVQETGTAGALIWSLRFRSREGGFYWHSEPAGGNKYKAYHWPGFASGADYDEIHLLTLLRQSAFAIREIPLPDIPPPDPPHLLPVTNAAAISWQGSVGAWDYVVERSAQPSGPWTVAGERIDETAAPYRPLFTDAHVGPGRWYYRVRARNRAGLSAPSHVAGPVEVRWATLVDELLDFTKLQQHQGALEFKTREARQTKEDPHRLTGRAGCTLTYLLAGPIRNVRLDAFFPDQVADFTCAFSRDGHHFTPANVDKQAFFDTAGDYGYWKPVRYLSRPPTNEAWWLTIAFTGEAQLARVEVEYDFAR